MAETLKSVADNHDQRINALEDSTASMKGKAIGAGLAAGFISSILGILAYLGFKK